MTTPSGALGTVYSGSAPSPRDQRTSCTPARGVNRCSGCFAMASLYSASGAKWSNTKMPRPCVASTRSPCTNFTSTTGTVGKSAPSLLQWPPLSREIHTPMSVPAPGRRGARVFAHDRDRGIRQALVDARPGLAVVVGAVDVGMLVIQLVRIEGDIGGARLEGRHADLIDARPFGAPDVGSVGPVLAAVAGHLHQAIVGTHPDAPCGSVGARVSDRMVS